MSTLRVNTLQNAAGTGEPSLNGTAKAWVNFNGTGTVAIRAAYNVSSITDNGVGDYTVNLTSALPDTNYSVCGSVPLFGFNSGVISTLSNFSGYVAPNTSNFRVVTYIPGSGAGDSSSVSISVFR